MPAPVPPPAPARPVPLGAAITWSNVEADGQLRDTLLREFDSITPENEMKMEALQPRRRGEYDFTRADAIVAFAQSNAKRVRGHTLVFGNQLPWWLSRGKWSREELLAILEDHVKTVVGRYRGRVDEWDVVNEAVLDDGSYRDSVWYRGIGPEYVELAFRWAREADPQARLFYNDIAAEWPGAKMEKILALARDFRSRGIPIDGIGLQMHTETAGYPRRAQILSAMRRYAEVGLDIAVTEMDVATSATSGTREQKLAAQAAAYGDAALACAEVAACQSFTTWGVGDRYTWIGSSEMPLLFDATFAPKPAYAAVRGAFVRPEQLSPPKAGTAP